MKRFRKIMSITALISILSICLIGCGVNKEEDMENYKKDISTVDAISTAVSVFVADPDSVGNYQDKYIYKLSTLMNGKITVDGKEVYIDTNEILKKCLKDTVSDDGKLIVSSTAFSGMTTDDVFIMIDNGMVNVYVKSKNSDFESYRKGLFDWSKVKLDEGPIS